MIVKIAWGINISDPPLIIILNYRNFEPEEKH